MTRSCPLPVDWLDYLDGGDPSLTEHLATCRSCQELVASLRAGVPHTIPQRWTDGIVGRTDAVWPNTIEPTRAPPSPAEFWFSAADFVIGNPPYVSEVTTTVADFGYHNANRVLVLVLSHPDSDHYGWTDVVPVLSDVEAATETDLLFSAEENTLGAPWRAMFANQSKVARDQLDTRVGTLTELGAQILNQAIAGEVEDARWGIPLQGPFDPRARLDQDFAEDLKRLRTPWLLLHGPGDRAESDRTDERPLADTADRSGRESAQGTVLWLTPHHATEHEFALAAASLPNTQALIWSVDRDALQLAGKLHTDFPRGLLLFLVTGVHMRLASRLRLRVVAAGKEYASAPFTSTQTEIELAKGVTSAQVEKLGAELLP